MSKGKLFVISGASGVGKSTVLAKVMESRKDLLFSVSATTRGPRPGEVDGASYYFVSKESEKDAKIYLVAERVGYQRKSYFYDVFRTYTGMSPSDYQRTMAGKDNIN